MNAARPRSTVLGGRATSRCATFDDFARTRICTAVARRRLHLHTRPDALRWSARAARARASPRARCCSMVERPGRIVGGTILLDARRQVASTSRSSTPRGRAIRAIRGRRSAMIFQEPMSSLSPVHTIGAQIIEALRLHLRWTRRRRARATHRAAAPGRDPEPRARWSTATPSSSPAACASAR